MLRPDKPLSEMQLPFCPTPRPEDDVVWYSDARQVRGKLLGHAPEGRPIVMSEFGNAYFLDSFDNLRLADPYHRRGPNWEYLGKSALIQSPYPHELAEFGRILAQITPPGPRYIELVTEIWSRGYEIFLVGGTVRDVLGGVPTNDVDLVTTMPLTKAIPLLTTMYRHPPDISNENGFVRLGGAAGSGDPFLDLKMFCHHEPGTSKAAFGNRFDLDVEHRDFACNSVYYDPVNQALIDPSGTGIRDAEGRTLDIVCDITKRAPFHLAQISIRFFKFLSRGFNASAITIQRIQSDFMPSLAAMDRPNRAKYVRTQLLSKRPKAEHEVALSQFKEQMIRHGADAEWARYIEPISEDILR